MGDELVAAIEDLIKAAKSTCQRWDGLAKLDARANDLIGSIFDPRHKPVDQLGLEEALMKIEDLLQKTEGQADG